jgi:hypothetical protein
MLGSARKVGTPRQRGGPFQDVVANGQRTAAHKIISRSLAGSFERRQHHGGRLSVLSHSAASSRSHAVFRQTCTALEQKNHRSHECIDDTQGRIWRGDRRGRDRGPKILWSREADNGAWVGAAAGE